MCGVAKQNGPSREAIEWFAEIIDMKHVKLFKPVNSQPHEAIEMLRIEPLQYEQPSHLAKRQDKLTQICDVLRYLSR